MFTLLHLSDPHFGSDHHFAQLDNPQGISNLARAVKRALADNKIHVNHIVFTGDFFSHEQAKDRIQAQDGIEALRDTLGLKNEDLSFIPGNHDKMWDKAFRDKPFVAYNELVAAFGQAELKADNLPVVKRINPASDAKPILLALLNSCTVEGKELAGVGNIGELQLDELKERLQEATEGVGEHVLLAALHHHLLPIYPVEKVLDPDWTETPPKEGSSRTLDALDVLNKLAEMNTALIIHGHQHRAAVVSFRDRLSKSPELTIAASGSCASRQTERQFYVYQISEHDIRIRSFNQSRDINRFSLDDNVALSIPLPHISSVYQEYCMEEAVLRHTPKTIPETSQTDSSDLHLLFLSVRDCKNARNIVRKYVEELPPEMACSLHGMYDLLGRWDLLVRLRFNRHLDFMEHEIALRRRLIAAHEMKEHGDDFTDCKHIDVLKEAKSFKELLDPSLNPYSLERTVLGNTEAYDSRRTQRGLLYIQLPDKLNRRNEMIKSLAGELDADKVFRNIVEGIYRGENQLVIESFMSCAQSQALNHLNRQVETTLTFYDLQKFTMFCYGYDEKELISA